MVETQPIQVRSADPWIIVIFGATGDLTKRPAMAALCSLSPAGPPPGRRNRHPLAYDAR